MSTRREFLAGAATAGGMLSGWPETLWAAAPAGGAATVATAVDSTGIHTVPLALISEAWIGQLFKNPPTILREMSLLVWAAAMGGNVWEIRLPEAIGSIHRPGETFRYVARQAWRMDATGDWSYTHTSWQQLNSEARPIPLAGEVSCRTRRTRDGLLAELSVRNADQVAWPGVYLWVCMMHKLAPDFQPATWLQLNGRFVPYQEACPQYFGPAGMRMLTERGRAERERLQKAGHDLAAIAEQRIAGPARCATGRVSGRPAVVGIASPDAAIVGGYDTNPCTDLAVALGDIPPGGRGVARVAAYFLPGTPEDFADRVAKTDWKALDVSGE